MLAGCDDIHGLITGPAVFVGHFQRGQKASGQDPARFFRPVKGFQFFPEIAVGVRLFLPEFFRRAAEIFLGRYGLLSDSEDLPGVR